MKVLLPIDGSIYSDRAVEYICEHSSLRAKIRYRLSVERSEKIFPPNSLPRFQIQKRFWMKPQRKFSKPAKKALEAAGYKGQNESRLRKGDKPNC